MAYDPLHIISNLRVANKTSIYIYHNNFALEMLENKDSYEDILVHTYQELSLDKVTKNEIQPSLKACISQYVNGEIIDIQDAVE